MEALFDRPNADEAFNFWILLSLIVFLIGLIISGVITSNPGRLALTKLQTKPFSQRLSTMLGVTSGAGLFFVLIRLLQIDPLTFGRGIWILLCWLALLALGGWYLMNRDQDRKERLAHQSHRKKSPTYRPVRKKR